MLQQKERCKNGPGQDEFFLLAGQIFLLPVFMVVMMLVTVIMMMFMAMVMVVLMMVFVTMFVLMPVAAAILMALMVIMIVVFMLVMSGAAHFAGFRILRSFLLIERILHRYRSSSICSIPI